MDSEKIGVGGHLIRGLVFFFATIYLVNSFLQISSLKYVLCVLMLIILIQGIPLMPKVSFRVTCGMLLAGAIILIRCGADWKIWVDAITQNVSLAVLFASTPMMALPFFYEDYQSELKVLAQNKMQSLLAFCLLVNISGHLLGVMISVGAFAIIYELLKPQSDLYQAEDVFLSSLLRSYSASGFWSPAWASVVLLTSRTTVTWVALIPIGIAFTIIYIGIDMIFVAIKMKKDPARYPRLTAEQGTKVNWRKIGTMLALAFVLILLIAVVSIITGWELMLIIPLVSLIFPLLCGLIQNHMTAYRQGMKKYYKVRVVKVRTEIALFAAAGFLGKALQASGIGGKIPALLPEGLAAYPALMCGAIMLLIILPSLIGIHPVAMGTAIVVAITPASIGMTDVTFVLTALTGWLLAILLSPFSATSLVAGNYTGRPSWDISIKLSGLFGVVCLVVFSILIAAIGPFLG